MHRATATGVEYRYSIISPVTCRDSFVIYTITCTKSEGPCKHNHVQYVGSTSKPANVRLGQHVGTVTYECHSDTTCPVGEHFRGKGHGARHMKMGHNGGVNNYR